MTQPISGIPNFPQWTNSPGAPKTAPSTSSAATGFQDLLLKAVDDVSAMQHQAEVAALRSVTDGDVTQVEALAALKKADLALRLMLQIRNKLLQAYQEIQQMRM